MDEVWEPCPYDDRMARCGSEETGYRYRRDGRPWMCAARCEFCREFGVYADTHRCPDCDERIGDISADLTARLERVETALRNLIAAASADMGIQCSDDVFKRLNCAVAAARATLNAAGKGAMDEPEAGS